MNVQSISFEGLSFVNVSSPSDLELRYLNNTYNFNPLTLEDYIHNTQIPVIENYGKYDLVVLRFPLFGENPARDAHQYGVHIPTFRTKINKKRRLLSSYVNFFISKEYLVVVHEGDLPQIESIFSQCQKTLHYRKTYMSQGSVFLAYKIIDALVDGCFPVINELTATIDKIDKDLEKKPSQKTLEEISSTRRNLVIFHTIIKPALPLFSALEFGKHKELNGQMRQYWSNILDHMQKIWDRVEDNQELIEGISEINESLLSVRSNEVIKVLTVVFTLSIPTSVMAAIYGMNIPLPGGIDAKVWTFWGPYTTLYILLGVSVISVIGMYSYFKYKNWF